MSGLAQVPVVAMLGHVEPADRHAYAFHLRQDHGEPPREDVTLADDADEHDIFSASISLHDLMGDARERAADLVGVHDRRLEAALSDAHARMTDSPEAARDSEPRW